MYILKLGSIVDFEAFKKEKRDEGFYGVRGISTPLSFPAVMVYDTHENHICTTYVYPTDFE